MVAWPLFAEQRLNAVMLSEGAGAAIRLPETKDKESIAAVVRELVEGEGKGAMVRAKVAQLQKAAAEGLREGGAATTALDEVMDKWEAEAN
jgi:hydroquinone glucosyltransferase